MPEPLLSIGIAASLAAAPSLYRSSSAVSEEANFIRSNTASIVLGFENSRALFGKKSDLLDLLADLSREYSQPDWDGEGAEAVSASTVFRTELFIRSLPESLQTPELSVEPDGAIALEWMPSRYKTFSISVSEGDRIAYAWVDGTDRGHAVARLVEGEIPAKLAHQLSLFLTDDLAVRIA